MGIGGVKSQMPFPYGPRAPDVYFFAGVLEEGGGRLWPGLLEDRALQVLYRAAKWIVAPLGYGGQHANDD